MKLVILYFKIISLHSLENVVLTTSRNFNFFKSMGWRR